MNEPLKNYKFENILGGTREGGTVHDPEATACKLVEMTGIPWKVVGEVA